MDIVVVLIVLPIGILLSSLVAVYFFGLWAAVVCALIGALYNAWLQQLMPHACNPTTSTRFRVQKKRMLKDILYWFSPFCIALLAFHFLLVWLF